MATDVLSLFNMPTQEQLGRSYLEGMLTSPAQMGSQGLLQQVVSLGGNAGAGLGYGAGRLMGGMTADEVRAKSIDDAMRTVQGMGLTSDAEMYEALSQELARRGLTQDALMARNTGLKAAQAEQSMATEKARLGIAQEDLKLKQAQDKREAELAPFKKTEAEAKAEAARRALTPLETRLGQAAEKEQELRASAPNSPEHRRAIEEVTALSREYQDARNSAMLDIQKTQAQIAAQEAARRASLSTVDYNAARAGQDKLQGRLGIYTHTDLQGRTIQVPLGNGVGNKIIGTATGKAYTLPEWEATGYTTEFKTYEKKFNPKADTDGDKKEDNKNIQGILERLYGGNQQGSQAPSPNQPQATATVPVSGLAELRAIDQQIAQMETMLQAARRSGDQRVIGNYSQALADLQNQKKVIASQVGR